MEPTSRLGFQQLINLDIKSSSRCHCRRHGLKVPHGKGYQLSTPEEFFNMKHASARNVIER
ncbi:hypothetical protein Gotur_027135 [Gossypium turneri]